MNKYFDKFIIKTIFKEYKKLEIFKAFITASIFFILLGAIVVIPVVSAVYLYIPSLEYFLVGIYMYLSLVSVYFNKIFVETLHTYKVTDAVDYDKFRVRASTVMTFLIFLIVFVIYIFLH